MPICQLKDKLIDSFVRNLHIYCSMHITLSSGSPGVMKHLLKPRLKINPYSSPSAIPPVTGAM